MTITVADFVELLPFSNKIEPLQVAAFIVQARQFDLLPILGHETLEALDALPATPVLPAPAGGVAAVAGTYYVRRERVYRALSATTDPVPVLRAEPADEDNWHYEQMLTLWSQYVRPCWVQQAFSRFLTTHGLNITKAGITVPIDRQQGTYERPSAAQLATLQAAVDTPADVLLSRLTRFLRAEGLLYFTDPTTGAGRCWGTETPNAGGHCAATTTRHRRPVRGINR